MFTCKCKECGKIAKVRYRAEKTEFCSNKCAAEYRYKSQRVKRVCRSCGKEFWLSPNDCRLKRGGGYYCSNACVNAGNRKGHYITCKQCGAQVWSRPAQNRQFCSKRCSNLYRWAKRKEEQQ